MTNADELARQPIYNIRSVAEKTGISPETMRAWERRYGFPEPHRNEKGYRLYSKDEIAALQWLKGQTEAGMTIGQAIKLLRQLKASGQDPLAHSPEDIQVQTAQRQSLEYLRQRLSEALISLNEKDASRTIRIGFDQHPIDAVLLELIAPVMVEIGDLWHQGKIPVAIEHFSTQLCRSHLLQAMDRVPVSSPIGRIVTACAPGEWHELGLLMLTIMLRERSWDVTYLGPNMSLERFGEVLASLKPQLVLFSATTPSSAEALAGMIDVLESLPEPKPLIGLGGQAFQYDPTLANRIPGTYFGPGADDAIRQIENLLKPQRSKA